MQDLAGWLRSVALEPAQRIGPLTVHPLTSKHGAPLRLFPWWPDEAGEVHVRWHDRRKLALVSNRTRRARLVLQGDELMAGSLGVEALSPRLIRPGAEDVAVPCRVRPAEPRRVVQERAVRLLDRLQRPPLGTLGYLAMIGGRLARLELFPSHLFCRYRWDWALGSVVGLAARLEHAGELATTPSPALEELAHLLATATWVAEAEHVFGLSGAIGPRGHVVRLPDEPVYLDLRARVRGGGVGVTSRALPTLWEDGEALELPQALRRLVG